MIFRGYVALRFRTADINSPAAAGVNCQEEGQSKERKRCPNSQGNFRIIENITADVEIWPYLMGPNFGQQNVVKTHNTCVVNFQILQYVQRALIRVVRCTLYTPMDAAR